MVTVAVAGGTGPLGRAISETLKSQGKHEVKILGRQAAPDIEKALGIPIVVVDYGDVQSLTKALEDHNINTVISTVNVMTSSEPERNLVRAANASKVTKRFIPSNFGIPYSARHATGFLIAGFKLEVMEELSKTSLEYTRVNNGYFLDYFGYPKVKTYLPPGSVVIDVANNVAAIPGSGDTPVVFTHTFDVAKFVAALLDQTKWQAETYIIGDKVTWNEFVKLAEAAKGTKFDVKYDSLEMLKSGDITELPSHKATFEFVPPQVLKPVFATFGVWFAEGEFNFEDSIALNRSFPSIKPMTVKELLNTAWKSA